MTELCDSENNLWPKFGVAISIQTQLASNLPADSKYFVALALDSEHVF